MSNIFIGALDIKVAYCGFVHVFDVLRMEVMVISFSEDIIKTIVSSHSEVDEVVNFEFL